jgi:hypothetical protein
MLFEGGGGAFDVLMLTMSAPQDSMNISLNM